MRSVRPIFMGTSCLLFIVANLLKDIDNNKNDKQTNDPVI